MIPNKARRSADVFLVNPNVLLSADVSLKSWHHVRIFRVRILNSAFRNISCQDRLSPESLQFYCANLDCIIRFFRILLMVYTSAENPPFPGAIRWAPLAETENGTHQLTMGSADITGQKFPQLKLKIVRITVVILLSVHPHPWTESLSFRPSPAWTKPCAAWLPRPQAVGSVYLWCCH